MRVRVRKHTHVREGFTPTVLGTLTPLPATPICHPYTDKGKTLGRLCFASSRTLAFKISPKDDSHSDTLSPTLSQSPRLIHPTAN